MSRVPIDGPWGFDSETNQIVREDGKYFALGIVQHPGGYPVGAVIEEPSIPPTPDGSPRIVGHVIVDVNPRGLVRAREAKGLNGPILELKPSSVSKGELESSGRKPDAIFEANPQRIQGSIAVFRNDVEFPDEEGIAPRAFIERSADGRSITALAKLGLL
jgi:hypothetical protein